MGGMRYRKMRIAWSVIWGLAAVLLIALWVFLGFAYSSTSHGVFIRAPYSAVVLAAIAVSIVPWFHCRFTIRTLLIATTLVAVVLGLIAWGAAK